MSRSACQLRGYHEWIVITDDDNWYPVAVECTECGSIGVVTGPWDNDE